MAAKTLFSIFAIWSGLAFAQIPDQGRFDYALYDNSDQPVGTYFFTIGREGAVWRITSEMNVDASFLLFPIRFQDHNTFTHDGKIFQSFSMKYLKDVPLQRIVRVEVSGERSANGWSIRTSRGGEAAVVRNLSHESFDEIRNLISRLVRPQAVLSPGQIRRALSLDPLSLEISEVESRGVQVESIEFQGRQRELFAMETIATDGNVKVKKFANGLIYLSRTPEGYALLKSAISPGF